MTTDENDREKRDLSEKTELNKIIKNARRETFCIINQKDHYHLKKLNKVL